MLKSFPVYQEADVYHIANLYEECACFRRCRFSKHSGVSAYFRKQYIKTGIFDTELSDIIGEAFDIRNDSDYDDYYVISKEDVLEQIKNAEMFYCIVKKYLDEKQK